MISLSFRTPWLITSLYLARISKIGIISYWLNKHYAWQHGFIIRFFWLGFVLRWSKYYDDGPYYIPFLDDEPH